jgi:hypothetical protein
MRAWVLLLVLVLRLRRDAMRNRAYLTRDSLLPPSQSAWHTLFTARVDLSFRNTMTLDVGAFLYLHSFVVASFTLGGIGPCSLDSYGILGLTLHYLNSCMKQKTLCQIFGITPAVCSRLLDVGLRGLDAVMDIIPECRIIWPSQARMDRCAGLVHGKVPGLSAFKVFGFVDGLNLDIQSSGDSVEQNAYYNGWKAGTFLLSRAGVGFGPSPVATPRCDESHRPAVWHNQKRK